MNRFVFLAVLLVITTTATHAQTGNVGIGTTTPNAKLHVNGDLQVDVLPSVTNATQSVVLDPGTGKFAVASYSPATTAIVGDTKQGFQTGDHAGWIKLDGRSLLSSTLTATQRSAAMSLGFSGSLPNAAGKVLKQSSAVALGATAGGNTVTIARTNLPNYTLPTGSTSTAGNHTHTENYISRIQTEWSTSAVVGLKSVPDNGYSEYILSGEGGSPDGRVKLRVEQKSHNTSNSGSHSHSVTVSSGGGNAALSVENAYLNTNTFIYLGD